MRCEHEHDDGAYVLGALSPAERAAYERHLATCSFCREAVADIAVLPGLLGRLDPADLGRLLDPASALPPPNRMPDLVTRAKTKKRHDRVRVFSTAAVAAVLALIAGVGTVVLMREPGTPTPAPAPTVAMVPVNDEVPVTARIAVSAAAGGSKVDLVCFYNRSDPSMKSYTVRLVAYGPDEEKEQLGSWVAAPGKEFSMSAATHFPAGNLSRLELVRNDGTALLAYDLP